MLNKGTYAKPSKIIYIYRRREENFHYLLYEVEINQ